MFFFALSVPQAIFAGPFRSAICWGAVKPVHGTAEARHSIKAKGLLFLV